MTENCRLRLWRTAPSPLRTVLASCGMLLAVLSMAGCGGTTKLNLAPVSGIVLYDGQPVVGAVVEFIQTGSPVRSVAITDDQGAFTLTSLKPGDGALVGINQVTVTKRTKSEHPAATAPSAPIESISDPHERRLASMNSSVAAKSAAAAVNTPNGKRPRDLLPAKYAAAKTSGLEYEVVEGMENSFQIVLAD
jgi:hypothetical protein